ncbi:MAG: metallophosphoesterase, partial [Ruminococcus flavefaciens]|nr:metallophosphoesterase [Ruminococcus flavefaciens]
MSEIKKKSAKYFFRRLVAVLLVILFVWWYNNYTLKITRTSISSAKLSEPVRIALISDYHASHTGISNNNIIGKINKIDPDIVFVLGDMYTTKSEWDIIEIPINLMKSLVDGGYPVYFSAGDHDTSERYFAELEKAGVHVMNYKDEILNINGSNLRIMGIDNTYYTTTFDLSREFTLDDSCYNILLAHIPNYRKFAQFGADLTLCADTHGGIIQLPFGFGPAYDALTGEWFPKFNGNRTVY